MRCHNCSGFNHTKDLCRNTRSCGYCAGEHFSNDCKTDNLMCVNCKIANESYGLSLDTKHHVWSKKCEILNNKMERVSKRTEYLSDK